MLLLLRCLRLYLWLQQPVTLDPQQAALLCAGHKLQAEIIHSVANRAESRFQKGRRAVLEVRRRYNNSTVVQPGMQYS